MACISRWNHVDPLTWQLQIRWNLPGNTTTLSANRNFSWRFLHRLVDFAGRWFAVDDSRLQLSLVFNPAWRTNQGEGGWGHYHTLWSLTRNWHCPESLYAKWSILRTVLFRRTKSNSHKLNYDVCSTLPYSMPTSPLCGWQGLYEVCSTLPYSMPTSPLCGWQGVIKWWWGNKVHPRPRAFVVVVFHKYH